MQSNNNNGNNSFRMVQNNPVRFNTVGFSALPCRYYSPLRMRRMAEYAALQELANQYMTRNGIVIEQRRL